FLMQFLHLSPVHFRPEMMLGVIPVIEPKQIVPFRVGTDSPRDRLIRIASIVEKETVQVGAALPQIIEWQEKEPKLPVQNETDGDGRPENCNLGNSPASIDPVLSFNFPVDRLRIFAEVTQENVAKRIFSFAVLSVPVNRNPIIRVSMLVRPVAIAEMVTVMNVLIEGLRNPERHRFHDAEEPVQKPGFEEGIVNEVV